MPRRGQAHHNAKLPDEDVSLIRQLRERYGLSFRQIAVKFECSMWTIRDICEYRTRIPSKPG